MSLGTNRLLFTGSFDADHHTRALDALCARMDAGARDVLYIVASGAARRRAVADLLARRSAVFGLQIVTLRSLPDELLRRAHAPKLEPIDPVVADVLVERALRVATAGRFSATTPLRGLASKAASTIDLLERHGATPERLTSVVADGAYGDGRVCSRTRGLVSPGGVGATARQTPLGSWQQRGCCGGSRRCSTA